MLIVDRLIWYGGYKEVLFDSDEMPLVFGVVDEFVEFGVCIFCAHDFFSYFFEVIDSDDPILFALDNIFELISF